MIIHCVFCDFRNDASKEQRDQVLQDLSNFSIELAGVLAFDFGPNRDFEQKSPNFSDGFVVRFKDQQALEAYAIHPTHKKLGAHLCDLCNGGSDGIMVFDLDNSK